MNRKLFIREANLQDVDEIASLFHNTNKRINIKDYTPAQIDAWAGIAPDPKKWKARLETKQMFIMIIKARVLPPVSWIG